MKKKRKFLGIFIFDILFFVFLFLLVYIGLGLMSSSMTRIQEFFAQTPDTSSPEFINEFTSMSALSNRMYTLLYFVFPLIMFIAYCVLQGLSFRREWKYTAKFSLISVVPFFLFLVILNNFFSNIMINVLWIVLFYASFVLYLQPDFKRFGSRLWNWRIMTAYLGYLVLMSLIVMCAFLVYVGTKIGYGWVAFAPIGIGLTALLSLLKKKIIEKFNR